MNSFNATNLPGRTLITESGDYLWFGGTDYLGMAHNATLKGFLHEGLEKYGLHFGSSRNNLVQLPVYEETETQLATFFHAPSALTVSSGMWAGQLLTRVLPDFFQQLHGSTITHWHLAPGTHPALWNAKAPIAKQPFEEWLEALKEKIDSGSAGEAHVVCADAVGSPEVRGLNLEQFEVLRSSRSPICLVIDDSHSTGVLGNGNGSYQTISKFEGIHTVVTSSLNKAIGIPGGLLLGDTQLTEFVRKSPWFAGASPIAPAYLYALGKGLKNNLIAEALELLRGNNALFSIYAQTSGLFQCLEQYPVYSSRVEGLYSHLLRHRMVAPSFPYPTPADTPVLRLVISALHTADDICQLINACREFERLS